MTEKRIKAMLEVWRKRLGLHTWQIAVVFATEHPKLDDAVLLMKLSRSQWYDKATLTCGPGVLDPAKIPDDTIDADLLRSGERGHDEFVEQNLVHELLHCALRDIMVASDLVREHLSPVVVSVWDESFRVAEERVVENMSNALVQAWSEGGR